PVAFGASARGHRAGDLEALVLELVLLVARLVTIQAGDAHLRMPAVLPLADDAGRLEPVAFDAAAGALHLFGGRAIDVCARTPRIEVEPGKDENDGASDGHDCDAIFQLASRDPHDQAAEGHRPFAPASS